MNDKSKDKNNNDKHRRKKKVRFAEDNDKKENERLTIAHAIDDGFVEEHNTTESSTPYTVTSSHPAINNKQHQSTKLLYDDVTLEAAKILLQLKFATPENLSSNHPNYTTKISWSHTPIKSVLNKNIDDKFENVSISAPICSASSVHNSNSSNMSSSSERCTQMRLKNYQKSNYDKRNIGDLQQTLSRSKLKTLQRKQKLSQMDQPPNSNPTRRRRTLLSPSELEEANRNEAVRLHMLSRNRSMQDLNELALDLLPTSTCAEIDRPRRSVSTHSTIHNINDSISGSLGPTSLQHKRRGTLDERLAYLKSRHIFDDSDTTNTPPPYQSQRAQSVPYLTRDLITPYTNFGTTPGSLRLNQSSQVTHNQQSNYIHPMSKSQIGQTVSHNIGNQNLNFSSDSNSFYPSATTHATETISHPGNYINQQSNYGLAMNEQTTQIAQPNLYLNEQVIPQYGLPSYPSSGHSVNYMGNEQINQQFNFTNDLNQARFIYDEPSSTNQMFQSFPSQRNRQFTPNSELTRYPYPAELINNSVPTVHRLSDQSNSTVPLNEHRFLVPQIPQRRTKTSRSRNKSVKRTPTCKPSNSGFMRVGRGFPSTVTSQHAMYPQTVTFPVTSTMTCGPENKVTTTMCTTPTMIGEPETPISDHYQRWISLPHSLVDLDSLTMSATTTMTGTPETPVSIAEEQARTFTMSSLNDVPATIYSTPQAAPLVNSTSTPMSVTTTITDAPKTSVPITEVQQRSFIPDLVPTTNNVTTITVSTGEATPIISQAGLTTPSSLHIQNVTYPVTTVMMYARETPLLVTSGNNNGVTLILTPETSPVPATTQSETVTTAAVHSQNSTAALNSTIALTTVLHPSNTTLLITVSQANTLQQRYITPHIAVMEPQKKPPSTIEEQSNALARRLISPHISVIQTPQNPPPMSQINVSATQTTTLPPLETLPPMPPLIQIPPHHLRSSRHFTRPHGLRPSIRATENFTPAQAHVPEVAHATQASSGLSSQPRHIYNSNLYLPTRPYSVRPDFYTPQRRYLSHIMRNRQPINQTAPEGDTDETNRQNANVPDNGNC